MIDVFRHKIKHEVSLIVPPANYYDAKYLPIIEYAGANFVDRTRTFTDCGYDHIIIDDQIPTDIKNPGEFSTIVDKTAKSIIEISKTKNKPIAVLYSGGLDSTCVTSAFLKHGAHINLVYSTASVCENLAFYEEVLANNNQITHYPDNPLLFVKQHINDYIFVTGECGAHLMGTINWSKYGGREIEDKDIIGADSTAAEIFKNPNAYFNVPDDLKTLLLRIYEKSPIELKTNYDAQWWAIFALKWQFVKYRMQIWLGELCENLMNFYMTDDFQMWALCNDVSVKCPNYDWKKYKMPIREYIYNFFPNEHASILMPKRMSMELTYSSLSMSNRFVMANPKRVAFMSLKEKSLVNILLHQVR